MISLLKLPGDSTPEDELIALEELLKLSLKRRIKISISEKSRTEAMNNLSFAYDKDSQNSKRIEKWLKTLHVMDSFDLLGGRFIIGQSRLGIDTVLDSDGAALDYERISQILFGKNPIELNDGNAFDLSILFEHFVEQNDFFIIRDKKTICLKESQIWKKNLILLYYVQLKFCRKLIIFSSGDFLGELFCPK